MFSGKCITPERGAKKCEDNKFKIVSKKNFNNKYAINLEPHTSANQSVFSQLYAVTKIWFGFSIF